MDTQQSPGLPFGIHFTISPVIPFVKGLDEARRELKQLTPFRKFGSFARPMVATDAAGVTIWRGAGEASPILSIQRAAIRSVSCDEQKVQVSRLGVTARFVCITLELQLGGTELSLILPACTVVGEMTPAPRELVDAWADEMRRTLGRV